MYKSDILRQLKREYEWIQRNISLGIVERTDEVDELLEENLRLQKMIMDVSKPGVYQLGTDGEWRRKE